MIFEWLMKITRRRPRKPKLTIEHLHELLHTINHKVTAIMASQSELAADLRTVTAQVQKIGVETGKTLQKVIDLEAIIAAGGGTTPEVDEALAALKAQAQATDDLVPDVTA